jgi:hypothetical protein
MFPNTLDDIPHKWYKIEEACGHTFNWNEIKENFIRDFEFIPEEAHLQEATKEIKNFLEKTNPDEIQKRGKAKVDMGSTSTCNFVSTQSPDSITTRSNRHGKHKFSRENFQWKKSHPGVNNLVKIVYSVSKEEKETRKT